MRLPFQAIEGGQYHPIAQKLRKYIVWQSKYLQEMGEH